MFELSDDDDEFWKDLPLLDVTKKTETRDEIDLESKSKRQCVEKENILRNDNDRNPGQVSGKGSIPTPVLPDFHVTKPYQNNFTCGFFTPVKSPEDKSNGAQRLEKSGPTKRRVQINHNISSVTIDEGCHGIITRDRTHGDLTTSRDIIHGERNNAWNVTPREVTTSSDRTHTEFDTTRDITRSGLNSQSVLRERIPGDIPSPRTPSVKNVPENTRWSERRGKRKFPGPAGRLPKLKAGETMTKTTTVSPESESKITQDVITCSQINDDVFNEASWKTLKQDLGPDAEVILDQFSVSSSLLMASKKTLPQGKIPLLFVVVESLDLQGAGGSVVLKDKTGRIKGTLHRDVIKEYGADIQPGTTLVLRQVGVVSPTSRNHYLNITPTNMVYLNTNTSNIQKHLFHHHSLKHFMADFKRKRKQEQQREDNSGGNIMASSSPQCSTNRILPNMNLSLFSSPTNFQHRGAQISTPTNRRSGAVTPNIGASGSGNRTSGVVSGVNCTIRATTPNNINRRLGAPSAPGGNMSVISTLNLHQRATTPTNCGTGLQVTSGAVNSRLFVSSDQTPTASQTPAGIVLKESDFHNFEKNNQLNDSVNSNFTDIPSSNSRNLNQNQSQSVNLTHSACENSHLTKNLNTNFSGLKQPNSGNFKSKEQVEVNSGPSSLSGRIVPTFGKQKTNLNTSRASNVTPSLQYSAQNNSNLNKTSSCLISTPKTSKFSFKSKTPISPSVQTVSPSSQVPEGRLPSSQVGEGRLPREQTSVQSDCESFWQDDDISDEMLTHLTEDMS